MSSLRRLLPCTSLLLLGCSLIIDTRPRCESDTECLASQRCEGGFCVPRDASDGGTGGGAGGGCQPESDAALCSRLMIQCGAASGLDNCGGPRNAQCGTCSPPDACVSGRCACTPESDADLCRRLGRACGPVSDQDNCGLPRTVPDCGTCDAGVCADAGVCPNCVPETDQELCFRQQKACGPFSGTDNCAQPRSVPSCGSCSGADVCGPTGACCTPETNPQLCARHAKNCGSFSSTDNCGQPRTASCGTACGCGYTCASNVCTAACSVNPGGNCSCPEQCCGSGMNCAGNTCCRALGTSSGCGDGACNNCCSGCSCGGACRAASTCASMGVTC